MDPEINKDHFKDLWPHVQSISEHFCAQKLHPFEDLCYQRFEDFNIDI